MTVAAIDLSRHAVIEASAGTGKTYTIEQLVLRMMIQNGTPLERILLVTFTEKATAELKDRLRKTLEHSVRDRPELIRPALDHFDQAPIFTIHGFCQRLLQEYALEQGQDFQPTLVDDKELAAQLLCEVQRKVWRAQFGNKLREVLEDAGYTRGNAGSWDRAALDIALKYQPRSDHQLRPTQVPDWWQRLGEAGANWTGQLAVFTIAAIRRRLTDHKKQRGQQSFDDMIGAVEQSLDPNLNPDAPNLLTRLRARYQFGIVDEFQDTDPLQWRIFRRIFVESAASRLFVVGDPKQAIFGFRSADLPTYLHATREMKVRAGAGEYPLLVNWRSTPEMLEALNCVFLDGEWFPQESGIVCKEVKAPHAEERQSVVVADRTGRAALTVVDMRAWERLKAAGKHYARFVTQEIQRLLNGSDGKPSLVVKKKGGEPRALNASDIGVLIRTWRDAEPIAEGLTKLKIPYSLQRETSFWKSHEVLQVETLLVCLSQPEDRSAFRKALLTCFFRIRPEELVHNPDLPLSHPARRLYRSWIEHAEARRWSALFQSVLEETALLLGALDDDAAEMRLAGLRQVIATLERVGHGENRDLLGLIEWIRDKRLKGDGGESEQPPAETQRPRVRIMTIHASKGLEFPIVFVAGGFTRMSGFRGPATYRDEQGRKVFDICPDATAWQRTREEDMSELRRLYYVALTRAMFKLYVPMVYYASKMSGYAGPIATVLLPALKKACPDKLGPPVAEIFVPPALPAPADAEPAAHAAPVEPPPSLAWSGPLFPVIDPNLSWRRTVVKSFSSMSRQHHAQVAEGPTYGDRVRLAQDEAPAAEKDDLLRGPVFGDIVHNVLEAIDFAAVGRCTQAADLLRAGAGARLVIEKEVRANVANLHGRPQGDLEQAAQHQVAQLVWSAMHTPLVEAGGPLHRIPNADLLREVEFQFPERPGEPLPADVRLEDGFVTGYMDLVFRSAGRYFLLDYKTNLLPGYTPAHLQRCMDDSDYHRQYRLYLHALDRWLARALGNSFDLRRHFGGVYYLFVRGLNGNDESTGVYFHRPTAADIDLAAIMAR